MYYYLTIKLVIVFLMATTNSSKSQPTTDFIKIKCPICSYDYTARGGIIQMHEISGVNPFCKICDNTGILVICYTCEEVKRIVKYGNPTDKCVGCRSELICKHEWQNLTCKFCFLKTTIEEFRKTCTHAYVMNTEGSHWCKHCGERPKECIHDTRGINIDGDEYCILCHKITKDGGKVPVKCHHFYDIGADGNCACKHCGASPKSCAHSYVCRDGKTWCKFCGVALVVNKP